MPLLLDGPLKDRWVAYNPPLPRTLVIADKRRDGVRWHDYDQTERFDQYRHSNNCPCRKQP